MSLAPLQISVIARYNLLKEQVKFSVIPMFQLYVIENDQVLLICGCQRKGLLCCGFLNIECWDWIGVSTVHTVRLAMQRELSVKCFNKLLF